MPIQQQEKKFRKSWTDGAHDMTLVVKVRHDDSCGNGHNSFAITGSLYDGKPLCERNLLTCGCIHDEIVKHMPELAKYIKWHLSSTDGPMYYVENTLYHARQHGPQSGWLYFTDSSLPCPIVDLCAKYGDLGELQAIAEVDKRYTVKIDEKTAKAMDLDAARRSAVWPDATLKQLRDKDALMARLPALLAEFRRDVESLGLVWDTPEEKS